MDGMVGRMKLTLRSDEAGEAPELMPGAAAEFLDDEREFPDGEDADALTPLQTYVLEIIEVRSRQGNAERGLTSRLTGRVKSRTAAERVKFPFALRRALQIPCHILLSPL